MARLRKAVSYRNLERPYTRKSKFRKANFVRASPPIKIVKFEMGNTKEKDQFNTIIRLNCAESMQIRQNAIESARLVANRHLEANIPKKDFFFMIKVYPHHILRMNPLASGAGADRMSTGMKKSFGKSIGVAAQVKKGQCLFELRTNKEKIEHAKKAIEKCRGKLPCVTKIIVKQK